MNRYRPLVVAFALLIGVNLALAGGYWLLNQGRANPDGTPVDFLQCLYDLPPIVVPPAMLVRHTVEPRCPGPVADTPAHCAAAADYKSGASVPPAL